MIQKESQLRARYKLVFTVTGGEKWFHKEKTISSDTDSRRLNIIQLFHMIFQLTRQEKH